MFSLHLISILIEAAVMILGILIGLKNKSYGWLIALTFGIYVFYDISKFFVLIIPQNVLYGIFFIASISIFGAVYKIYKENQ